MSNPFATLAPAFTVLATEGRVLPATGQAIVDLSSADPDEIYDRILSETTTVEGIWETQRRLYQAIRPIPRSELHLLRYFWTALRELTSLARFWSTTDRAPYS